MNPLSNRQLPLFEDGSYETWSYSRLKTLRRCALEYKVRWVDSQQALFQPGHIDIQAGRLLHYIIREYYRAPLPAEPHKLLLEIYEKLAPRTSAWREDLQGEIRTLSALKFFAHSEAASFRPVALEVGCKARVGGALFIGQADLIYQTHESSETYGILEFKLNDVEVRSEDEVERFLQCLIYYIGLPEQYRRYCELVSIYVFNTGDFLKARIQQTMIDRTIEIVNATLPLAEGPDFQPTLNPFCPSCGYQNLCPAYSRYRPR